MFNFNKIKKYFAIAIYISLSSQVILPVEVCAHNKNKVVNNDMKNKKMEEGIGNINKNNREQNEDIKRQRKNLEESKKEAQEAEEKLDRLNKENTKNQEELYAIDEKIRVLDEKRKQQEKELKDLGEKQKKNCENIGTVLREKYMGGSIENAYATAITTSKNLRELSDNTVAVEKVSEKFNDLQNDFAEKKEQIEDNKSSCEKNQEDYKETKRKLEKTIKDNDILTNNMQKASEKLHEKTENLTESLENAKKNSENFENLKNESEEANARLNTIKQKYGKIVNKKPQEAQQPPANVAPPNVNNSSSNESGMVWPVPQSHDVSQYYSSGHRAIDIRTGHRTGLETVAVRSGVVLEAGPRNGYGNTVLIQFDDGLCGRYAHLARMGVKAGQRVEKGKPIGIVGTTGNSSGIHLHFEIIKGGSKIDPMSFYSGKSPSNSPKNSNPPSNNQKSNKKNVQKKVQGKNKKKI